MQETANKTTVETDVVIPLLKGIAAGGLIGLSALTLGIVFKWESPLAIAAVGFALSATFGFFWFASQAHALHNPPPPPAPPEPMRQYEKTVRIRLDRVDSGGYVSGAWFDLPIDEEKVIAAALELQRGRDFSMGSMAGKGKPLSRAEYECLRDELILQALCQWVNPHAHAQGVYLNGAGREFMRKYARAGGWTPPTTHRSPGSARMNFS